MTTWQAWNCTGVLLVLVTIMAVMMFAAWRDGDD